MRFCQYSTLAALPLLALAAPQGIQQAQDVQVAQSLSSTVVAALLPVQTEAVEALTEEADVVRLELRQAVESTALQTEAVAATATTAVAATATTAVAATATTADAATATTAAAAADTAATAATAATVASAANTVPAAVDSFASTTTAVAAAVATSTTTPLAAVATTSTAAVAGAAQTTAAAATQAVASTVATSAASIVTAAQAPGVAQAGAPVQSQSGSQASDFVTSYWMADHWDATATSEVWSQVIYSQSFESYPGQMSSAASGSIGMGTHTGAIGVVKSSTSDASLMAQGTLFTFALGLAGVTLGMVGVLL